MSQNSKQGGSGLGTKFLGATHAFEKYTGPEVPDEDVFDSKEDAKKKKNEIRTYIDNLPDKNLNYTLTNQTLRFESKTLGVDLSKKVYKSSTVKKILHTMVNVILGINQVDNGFIIYSKKSQKIYKKMDDYKECMTQIRSAILKGREEFTNPSDSDLAQIILASDMISEKIGPLTQEEDIRLYNTTKGDLQAKATINSEYKQYSIDPTGTSAPPAEGGRKSRKGRKSRARKTRRKRGKKSRKNRKR